MNYVTKLISEKGGLPVLREVTNNNYGMFNTGGVECEVGELLYSLVRITKPKEILETGTYYGISSTYMGLAVKENGFGRITTLDLIYHPEAKKIHSDLELTSVINQVEINSLIFEPDTQYSLILLDTEPSIRFEEFKNFFDFLCPGGLIIIHDLHPHLSYSPNQNKDLPYSHWPFGNFIPDLGDKYIKEFRIQTFSLPTPRGITIFQKESNEMSYVTFLKQIYDRI
jgi:predicted O-methyltransferase YrrM